MKTLVNLFIYLFETNQSEQNTQVTNGTLGCIYIGQMLTRKCNIGSGFFLSMSHHPRKPGQDQSQSLSWAFLRHFEAFLWHFEASLVNVNGA